MCAATKPKKTYTISNVTTEEEVGEAWEEDENEIQITSITIESQRK